MKRILSATLATALLSVASLTCAAVAVPEPTLPEDIASWGKMSLSQCTRHGNLLSETTYYGDTQVMKELVLNRQRVALFGWNKTAPGSVFYVKNSSTGTWFMYSGHEMNEINRRVAEETTLVPTSEESRCAPRK